MPRKPGLNSEFVMFDVLYEDGTQRSNRKVPRTLTGGIDGDKPAHGFLIEQDRDIAEKSGRPLAKIKSITRSGARKKNAISPNGDRISSSFFAPAHSAPHGRSGRAARDVQPLPHAVDEILSGAFRQPRDYERIEPARTLDADPIPNQAAHVSDFRNMR